MRGTLVLFFEVLGYSTPISRCVATAERQLEQEARTTEGEEYASRITRVVDKIDMSLVGKSGKRQPLFQPVDPSQRFYHWCRA